jgi:N-carbamoylputrescine amidase
MKTNQARIGLIQTDCSNNPADNYRRTVDLIRSAAEQGANIICLQELFLTPYFCQIERTEFFDLAEPIPGPTTQSLCELARELGVVIVASLFEKRARGLYHNTAAVIDADGTYLGKYRKMHIPEDPGFHEKFYFTPGDLGYRVWNTRYGRIGILICWDQWYPEAARLTALQGADVLIYPTAIGWVPEEKEELGAAQYTAWETVQRGHAVANGCYVVAVNRIGVEGNLEFWGKSFVCNPYGQIIAQASESESCTVICNLDWNQVEEFRRIWPFFRDRRIDTYSQVTDRYLDKE